MKKLILSLLCAVLYSTGLMATTVLTVGSGTATGGTHYATLKEAFAAINGGLAGTPFDIQIINSTSETSPAQITKTSVVVNVYPTVTGKTISMSGVVGATIEISNADNITIDGRLRNSSGVLTAGDVIDLTIENTYTAASNNTNCVVAFLKPSNTATNDKVTYCNLKGSNAAIVYFNNNTTGSGTATSNVISYNKFMPSTATRPTVGIFISKGENSTLITRNSFENVVGTYGIQVSSDMASTEISYNSFYETTPFTPTVSPIYILLGGGTSLTNTMKNNTIKNNWIGGTASECGVGTGNGIMTANASTKSFIGIQLKNAATLNTVSANIIKNISWTATSSSPTFTGISISTNNLQFYNTVNGNFIGEITYLNNASGGVGTVIGIDKGSEGTLTAGGSYTAPTVISNNIINLGGDNVNTIRGIRETGIAEYNTSVLYNTVYISGSPTSGSAASYCFTSLVSTNARDIRNNIFVNTRLNTSAATGKHYGSYITAAGGTITSDCNDYYVTDASYGFSGFDGTADVAKTSKVIVSGQDANSSVLTPGITAGTTPASFKGTEILTGVAITGTTKDYDGTDRASANMGAYYIAASGSPTISTTGTPSALTTTYGTASTHSTFNVSGANITGGILVTPPAGFEVSLASGSGYASTVTVPGTGTINATDVYIRLTGAAAGNYSGNIALSSSSAATINVAIASSTVSKLVLTITANNVSKNYGTTLSSGAGSTAFTSSGLLGAETIGTVFIQYGSGVTLTSAVGVYNSSSVVPSAATGGTFNANNYTISYVAGTITVNARPLTITATNVNKTYGDALSAGGAGSTAFTQSGFYSGEGIGTTVTITYGTGTEATDAADTYNTVVPSDIVGGTFIPSNYAITYTNGNIIIGKKALTITAAPQTVTYGTVSAIVTGAGTYTPTGFVNNEGASVIGGSISYSTNYTNSTAVGASGKIITPIVTALTATNYSFTAAAGIITISIASPSISVSGTQSFTYSGAAQGPATITYSADGTTSLLYTNTDGAAYSSATAPTNAGNYKVVATATSTSNSNAATSADYTFSIAKVELTITATNQSVIFGTATSIVTGAGTYTPTGFVNNEGAGVIGGSATYSTSYTHSMAATTSGVTITPDITGLTATNYSFTPADGIITIDAQNTVTVPAFTSQSLSGPGALAVDAGTDLVVNNTGTLTVNASSKVNSVTIESGGKLDVTSPLTVETVIFKADKFTAASATPSANTFSTKLDASITATTVRLYKTIDDLSWYFMSFPCDVNVTEITKSDGSSLGTLGAAGDWYIKYYDGQNRATNGTGSNWKHIAEQTPDPTKLLANHGYIFGLKTLISGTYNVELSIPLTPNVLLAESNGRTVPVTAFSGIAGGNNYGWNLVGQPYMSNFNGNGTTTAPYMSFPDGNNATYSQISNAEDFYIPPTGAYFVQIASGTAITFDRLGRQGAKSIVTSDLSDRVQLNFISATGIDKTNLIMDNAQSTAYEIGQDLEKMIGTGTTKPQIYSMLGGINYAYNALPMSSVTNLPIGIYTKTAGSTTISVDASQAPSLSKLILRDNGVSPVAETNLLTSNYSFTAAAGTNTTRFAITAQRITTDNITIDNELGEIGISIVNGKLSMVNVLPSTSVQVYDALGRMLISKTANSNEMEIKLNVRGIYTVQMQLGSKIWSKKVIF